MLNSTAIPAKVSKVLLCFVDQIHFFARGRAKARWYFAGLSKRKGPWMIVVYPSLRRLLYQGHSTRASRTALGCRLWP
ncbi:unnamed protein product [Victoria cruziana]